jgi:hypothetical protein
MASVFNDISNFLSGGDLGAGTAALNASAQILGNTALPDLNTLIPQLQKQVQDGTMTAAQAAAALQQASALNGIQTSPELAQAQLNSVDQLEQVATNGGLTPADKAQLLQIQQQVGNQNAAQQQAIDTAAAQQGLSNSGTRLASKMLASQGNATGAMNAGSTVAANAQNRALQAMQQYGNMAQSQQGQQYNQAAKTAESQNAINQFNAANQQQTNQQNALNQQQANLTNFNMGNQIAGTNTGIANQQAMMPYNAAQTNYSNTLNRNIGTSNALNKQGTALIDQGNKQATTNTGLMNAAGTAIVQNAPAIASAIGSAASTVGGWGSAAADWLGSLSDERQKENIKPADDDIEAMMEKLTGKKFKYKASSGCDDGKEHISPMAQDVEKAGLPVANSDRGKVILNNDQSQGAILAALGNLHRRISSLEA